MCTQPDSKDTLEDASGKQETGITFEEGYVDRLPFWLIQRLEELGFTEPTPVQSRALDVVLPRPAGPSASPGRDAIVHAQTGSGKTLAYLLPMIAAVEPTRSSIQGLIIVPTQELGMQVYKVLRRLTASWTHVKSEHDAAGAFAPGHDAVAESGASTLTRRGAPKTVPVPAVAGAAESLTAREDLSEGIFDERTDGDAHVEGEAESEVDPDLEGSQEFPVLPMLDQADSRRQKLQLRRTAPRIIVGNPLRVAELVKSGRLRLDLLKMLVVDEFDACLLDTSTTSALQAILSVRGRHPRQTILVSATVPQHRHFLRQCARERWTNTDIAHVWVEEGTREITPVSIAHCYALCEPTKKLSALRALLVRCLSNGLDAPVDADESTSMNAQVRRWDEIGPLRAIAFVHAKRPVHAIVDKLNEALSDSVGRNIYSEASEERGVGQQETAANSSSPRKVVVGLHNDMSVFERRSSMQQFRDGRAVLLVATDVGARGLDIPDISHVFHVDLPQDADGYLHRSGRAGRNGKEGASVALVGSGEAFVIRRIANKLMIGFDPV